MGMKRTCKRYKKVRTPRGKELRCADFRKGRGRPPCWPGLVDGGRSPGLLRGRACTRKRGYRHTTKFTIKRHF